MIKRRESKAKDLDVLECVLVTGGFSAFITFCCCYSSSSFSGGAGGEDDVCLLLVQEQKRVKRRERSLFLPQQQI